MNPKNKEENKFISTIKLYLDPHEIFGMLLMVFYIVVILPYILIAVIISKIPVIKKFGEWMLVSLGVFAGKTILDSIMEEAKKIEELE